MVRREQKAGVKAVNFKTSASPHWKCELSWPGPEHSACPCLFPLLQSPAMKQQVGLWMAKSFQFLQLPPYRSRMSPMLFLPGRAQWQCTEWSGSSWAQGHLHHCSASSRLQASYKEKKKKKTVALTLESVFSKSSSDTSCDEDKILMLQSDSCNSVKGAEGTKILSAN